MTKETTFIKNEQLFATKKLFIGVTSFNCACFGLLAALAAITGNYMLFVGTFLLCLVNIVFFMYGYNKYSGEAK